MIPYTALGGFLQDDVTSLSDNPDYFNSTALIITMTLQNYLDKEKLKPSMAWEKRYICTITNNLGRTCLIREGRVFIE